MTYICIICTGRIPFLLSLSGEHRQILEAIMSPTINLAELKCFPLWICAPCQALIDGVQAFKNKALAGASHLLSRLALVQDKQDTHLQPENSPLALLPVKQDPDNLLEAKSFVEFEIHEEKLKPQELEANVKAECFDSDGTHSETLDPLTNPGEHRCQDSHLSLIETSKVEPAVSKPAVCLPTPLLHSLTAPASSAAVDRQTDILQLPDLFLCRICEQRVPTSQTDAHTALHTTPYCCNACSYETSDKGEIVRHRCDGVIIEKSSVKSLEGQKGGKSKNPTSRVGRTRGPRPNVLKEFRCIECYLRFTDDAALQRHILKYQKKAQGPHVCEICKKELKNKCKLRIHMGTHKQQMREQTVNTTKPELFCAECGVQFPTKQRFRSHMNSLKHTPRDKWKFKCDMCEKLFDRKYELKIHVTSIHLKKSDYECPKCHKLFWRRNVLRKHVETVHEGKAQARPHVCHECGAAFAEKHILTNHLTRHSDVRPHACPLCTATFKFKAALFTHNRLKHLKIKGKKPEKGKEKKKEQKIDAESLGKCD